MRRLDRRINLIHGLIRLLRRLGRRGFLLNYRLACIETHLNSPCRNCSFTIGDYVHFCECEKFCQFR